MCVRRVDDLLLGIGAAVNDELQWLAAILDPRGTGNALPDLVGDDLLDHLAEAYAQISTRIRSSSVLGTSLAPILLEDAERAERVRARLLALREVDAVESHRANVEIAGGHLELLAHCGGAATLAFDLMVSHRSELLVPDLGSTSMQHRASADRSWSSTRTFALAPRTAARVRERLAAPGIFDGMLARLLHADVERDLRDGRIRLHLRLAETTYGGWLADHNVGFLGRDADPEHAATGRRVRQMAVAVLVRTGDDRLVLVQRSGHTDVHRGRLMPSANGNIQLNAAPFTHADVDRDGVPDPLAAMARELKEELGVEVGRSALAVIGLGCIDLPDVERGTNLLVALCSIDDTVEDVVRAARRNAFTANGWETGAALQAIPLERVDADPGGALAFARYAPALAPHARLALILALIQRGAIGLSDLDAPSRPLPELAESWSITGSRGGESSGAREG